MDRNNKTFVEVDCQPGTMSKGFEDGLNNFRRSTRTIEEEKHIIRELERVDSEISNANRWEGHKDIAHCNNLKSTSM